MYPVTMNPFSIEVQNEVGLFQLKDGRYQLTSDVDVEPIMIGHGYVLFQNDIAERIKSIDITRMRFEPAIIWNRKTDKEYTDYQSLITDRHFDSNNLYDVNLEGKQFLILDSTYLFATPDLKIALEKLELGIRFNSGFENFG
jgi:hypothetical protein